MTLLAKIDGAVRFAAARLLGRRMPIVVRWQVTNTCRARCAYCRIWQSPSKELDTGEAKRMLREFYNLGMRRLCLSGGEPLERGDIGEVIAFGSSLGLSMEMNTNGLLLRDHLRDLRVLELVKVSLDGPEPVHDGVRRTKLFHDVMEGVRAARKAGVRLSFTTTLVRENAEVAVVDDILDIAREFDTFVAFQPVVSTTPWGSIDMEAVAPDREKFREVVRHLIERKREGVGRIRNSMAGLEHVMHWPEFPALPCTAGIIFAVVESNGDLYACERTAYPPGTAFPNVREGVREAFENIVFPRCGGCGFCGALELNFLWSKNLSVWREVARVAGIGVG